MPGLEIIGQLQEVASLGATVYWMQQRQVEMEPAALPLEALTAPAIQLLLLMFPAPAILLPQIMEIASFEKFLTDKIKVGNKTGE